MDPNGMLVQGFILSTGIVGQLFVSQMNPIGFWFWLASNVALIAVTYIQGSFGMLALYIFFSAMCLYSIYRWRSLKAETI